MSLTLNIPPTPPSAHSPASHDSNTLPRTPTSPDTATLTMSSEQPSSGAAQQGASTSNNQMKRKPSRRANTAERRATHNAVERQRRETLNGRFLDLAALLPNLSQIRRPSKSSIVNSSIAHIHAFRRHRLLASRELRTLKAESDALRRELNEWRDRAALPRVEEPPRSEGFATLLSGEIEVLATLAEEDDENGGQGGYDDYGDDGDDYPIGSQSIAEEPEVSQAALLKNMSASSLAHNMSPGASTGHILGRPAHGPMIASQPPSVSYENPAMASLYEPHSGFAPGAHFLQQQQQQQQQDVEKAWSAQYFLGPPSQVMTQTQQQQILQAPRSFLTPPGSAHSMSPLPSPIADNAAANVLASQAIFANFQRQQQQLSAMQQQQLGHLFGSPELDDASSISSGGSGRDGSMSMGNGGGSGYCTPPIDNTYDEYTGMGHNRRVSTGSLHINTPAAWRGLGADGGVDGLAMLGQSMGLPIGVGGGGNGSGFMMRM